MNPSLRTDVRSVMLNFAAAGVAFDAARVASHMGAQASDVAPEIEYTFWDGALMPFAYRRQARTGLTPLYTSTTGELPGVFAEGRPDDPRSPESMPREWIVESPGVLFQRGERAPFELSLCEAVRAEPNSLVHVEWRRSPTERFNIVTRVVPADSPGKPYFGRRTLGKVVHVDPALRGVTVQAELGELAIPLVPGVPPPAVGEYVCIEWRRSGPGHSYVPSPPQRLPIRAPRYFPASWLARLDAVLEETTLPTLAEILASSGDYVDHIEPTELLDVSASAGNSIYALLWAIESDFQEEGKEWIFSFDYKDPDDALRALMPRLGVTKLPSSSAYEAERAPWIAALNSAAAKAGSPLRVYEVEGNGDDCMVVAVRPSEWTALVEAGCLVPGAESIPERFARTPEEAREALFPSWNDGTPFASSEELFAFLTSRIGQFEATKYEGQAWFDVPTLPMGIIVTSRTGVGGEWVLLNATLLEGKWKRTDAVVAADSLVAPHEHLVIEDESIELQSAMPLRCLTPALMLELFGSFYRQLHETAKALGLEKD